MKKVLLAISIISMIFLVGCNSKGNTENNLSNDTDNQQQIENNKENIILKLDDSKDFVYDADYEYNVDSESYSIGDTIYHAKDIVVPYININSESADQANKEIKEVFNNAIKSFNEGLNDGLTYVDECKYKQFVNDDIASLVLTFGVGSTDVVHPDYYTYNFYLHDGSLLSYEDIYKLAGFNTEDIESKVQETITSAMKEKLKDLKDPLTDTGSGGYYPDGTNFETYNNESISNYKLSASNNTIKYFIDSNQKLNVVVRLSIPAGMGFFDTILTVE